MLLVTMDEPQNNPQGEQNPETPQNAQDTSVAPQQSHQPSLMKPAPTEKKKLVLPPKSFVIAAATILVTIIGGVAIALYLGKLTQRGLKQNEKPVIEDHMPNLVIPTPETQQMMEGTPSSQEATDSGSFNTLLQPSGSNEATPSGPRVATGSALP